MHVRVNKKKLKRRYSWNMLVWLKIGHVHAIYLLSGADYANQYSQHYNLLIQTERIKTEYSRQANENISNLQMSLLSPSE